MRAEIIACWLLLIVGCGGVAAGLYSINNENFGVTNVCNEQFYPELCGKAKSESDRSRSDIEVLRREQFS